MKPLTSSSDIAGQLNDEERRLLTNAILNAANKPEIVVEVGTWLGGGSTLHILRALERTGVGHLWGIEADLAQARVQHKHAADVQNQMDPRQHEIARRDRAHRSNAGWAHPDCRAGLSGQFQSGFRLAVGELCRVAVLAGVAAHTAVIARSEATTCPP